MTGIVSEIFGRNIITHFEATSLAVAVVVVLETFYSSTELHSKMVGPADVLQSRRFLLGKYNLMNGHCPFSVEADLRNLPEDEVMLNINLLSSAGRTKQALRIGGRIGLKTYCLDDWKIIFRLNNAFSICIC